MVSTARCRPPQAGATARGGDGAGIGKGRQIAGLIYEVRTRTSNVEY